MKEKIESILQEIENFSAQSKEQVEEYRIKWLSKKGEVTVLFDDFKNVAPDLKREFGAKLNELKNKAQEKINELKEKFESQNQTSFKDIDLSLPAQPISEIGALHPINIVKKEITKIFEDIGFTLSEGREIEDDWHNFTALNTPEDHPARDMQDTFYIQTNPEIVLRTQTSSVQVHLMENNKLPIRTISPGRVYRNETVSARSHCQFHQIEGLYIDTHVSFADLKQTILYFAQRFFGADTKIRLRPSFFPFTEPSAEVDISCTICKGEGCNICKYSGWLEILGCGMVDPQVLTNCGIDATKYTGFAFGMGIERIAMLKYKITDIRLFFENDVRFFKTISVGVKMPTRLEQLQQMLLQEPNDEFLQYAIAIEYFSVNNFEKALDNLNAILNNNPDYLAAYYQAGKCYEELKQFEGAKGIYTKGIEIAQKQNKTKTGNELKEALFLLEDE